MVGFLWLFSVFRLLETCSSRIGEGMEAGFGKGVYHLMFYGRRVSGGATATNLVSLGNSDCSIFIHGKEGPNCTSLARGEPRCVGNIHYEIKVDVK